METLRIGSLNWQVTKSLPHFLHTSKAPKLVQAQSSSNQQGGWQMFLRHDHILVLWFDCLFLPYAHHDQDLLQETNGAVSHLRSYVRISASRCRSTIHLALAKGPLHATYRKRHLYSSGCQVQQLPIRNMTTVAQRPGCQSSIAMLDHALERMFSLRLQGPSVPFQARTTRVAFDPPSLSSKPNY